MLASGFASCLMTSAANLATGSADIVITARFLSIRFTNVHGSEPISLGFVAFLYNKGKQQNNPPNNNCTMHCNLFTKLRLQQSR